MKPYFQKHLQSIIEKYISWVTAHTHIVIIAVALITLLFATQYKNLHIYIDPDQSLPGSHPNIILGKKIHKIFGGKYSVIIGIEVKNGDIYNPITLTKIQRITKAVQNIPGVLPSNVLSLSSANVKAIQGTPDGMNVTRLMPEIPSTHQEIDALKKRMADNPEYQDLLVSKDGKMAAIISDYASMEQRGAFSRIYLRLQSLRQAEEDGNTVIRLAGIPVTAYWLEQYSLRMVYVFPLAFLMIGLWLFAAFRTIQGVIIPILTATVSVAWSLGMIGLLHIYLDPYNLVTPILVLAVAAGHSVQILKRYYEEYNRLRDNRMAVIESTSRVGVAMLTAGFVAAVGFASLVTFETPSIRHFGMLTAFGILSAMILEMTFIPALRTLFKPPTEEQMNNEKRQAMFDAFILKMIGWLQRPGEIIILYVLLLVIAVIGASRVRTNDALTHYFFHNSRINQDIRSLNKKMAGVFLVQVLAEGKNPDALKDPQALRDIEKLQQYIQTLPNVGKTFSLVDMLKKMNQAMHEDNPGYYRVPDSRELIAQYLLLYSMSGDPGDFDRLVDFNYQRGVINVYNKSDMYMDIKHILSSIDNYIHSKLANSPLQFHSGGGITYQAALSEVIINGKQKNILQVGGIIFLISSLVFFSFFGGLLVLLPLVLSVLLNLAVMGICGIWLNIATATISAMAMGMGADYVIYFLFRFREELAKGLSWEQALAVAEMSSGKAVLFVASAIALGYLCVCLSGFLAHIYLGTLVPLTMLVSSLASLTIVPALVLKIKPVFMRKFITDADCDQPSAITGGVICGQFIKRTIHQTEDKL